MSLLIQMIFIEIAIILSCQQGSYKIRMYLFTDDLLYFQVQDIFVYIQFIVVNKNVINQVNKVLVQHVW